MRKIWAISLVTVASVGLGGAVDTVMAARARAAAVTTTNSYSITITVVPGITSINLSNTTVSTASTANAGAVVGAVSVVTNPVGGTFTGTIVLGGTSGAKFALTNGGKLPCNLTIGAANVAAGTYAISLSATQ